VDILDPQGKTLASQTYTAKSIGKKINVLADQNGWITLRVTGRGLPAAGAAYELTLTYTATQELKA
jgi:hypothetical protein